MNEWTVRLESMLLKAQKHARNAARVIGSIGDNDPFEVLAYRGYGNTQRAHVYGRALEKRNVSASTDSDSTFRNLLNTYRRADSDPLPFAQLKVEYGESVVELKADDEGFFSGWIELAKPITDDDEWQKYSVSLVAPVHADAAPPVGTGEILVMPSSARFGVISDIDDTVIQSRVSNFLQAARTVMLGNARTRLPFTGVAAFYRALRDGAGGDEKNPIYYVSSSPWNIYDVITEFMDIQKIPPGPLILRDWDLGWGLLASSRHLEHKVAIPKLSDGQVVVGMMKLLRAVGDGHTGILRPPAQADYALALPLRFYLFTEGLFIIGADPKYKELLGARVVRFGEHSVDEVMRALDPVISRDNEIWPSQIGPYRMRSLPLLNALGMTPDIHRIRLALVSPTGEQRTATVEADTNFPDIWNEFPKSWITYAETLGTPLPLYLKNTNANYWFEYDAASKVIYFQFNRVINDPKESLSAFSERLFRFINEHDVSKLVIDMRWNNGGNTFLSRPLINRIIRSDKVDQPGKLFVIIGRRTFSAAQNTATYFERYTNAIFVGEPTGSSPNFVGEETPFTLPYSKIVANVSDLYWESSWPQDHRKWIAPQIYLPPTFAAYRANRDPALEAILAYR